jgi:hypothetical protein
MHVPVLSARRLTGLAVIACAAAQAPAAALAAASSPAATAAVTPHSPASGLVIWMDTPGSGAAGSVFYTVHETRKSVS